MKKIALIRHGETEWALKGKHTGHTDIPLTEKGIQEAKDLAPLLQSFLFEEVFVSPLKRAKDTFLLSGLQVEPQWDKDLYEWDYGKYEGLTTDQIQETDPNWSIFTKGAPDGESLDEIKIRADRMIAKAKKYSGNVAFFSSGHFLRALASRFLEASVSFGKHLPLSTGSLSILSYEKESPVILLWNLTPKGNN